MAGWFGRSQIPENMIELSALPVDDQGAPIWNDEIEEKTKRFGDDFVVLFVAEVFLGMSFGGYVAKTKYATRVRTYEATAVLLTRNNDELRTTVSITAPGYNDGGRSWIPYSHRYSASLPKEHVKNIIFTIRGLCEQSHAQELLKRGEEHAGPPGVDDTPSVEDHASISEMDGFSVGEFVVYPAHGVGQIQAIERQTIAGVRLDLFVIAFAGDRMMLRVPAAKVANVGMRKIADVIYQDLVGIEDADERRRRIIAAAERQTQAAPSPPRPFIGVPPRIPSFTGREDQLSRLDEILIHNKPAVVTQAVQRVAVQGMGGVGKTSLAVEYAHRYRSLYAGVCWCPAETREGLFAALRSLGAALGCDASDAADPEDSAKAVFHRLAEQRANWLLVYDNVASPNEIAQFLPSAGARALITSRFLDWTGLADEIALDTLSPEEAVSFLQSRAGRQDAEGARVLADALGYLPLALDHAAAYCKRAQVSFGEYAKKAAALIASAPRDVLYPRSVAATFDLALGEAETRCPAAEEVMAFLGYCGPTRVPIYFLQALTNREVAIAVLAELSLIRHDPYQDGVPAITTHRLVQAVARRRTEAKGAVKETLERVTKGLSTTPPPSPQKGGLLVNLRQLTPQLRSLAHQRHWFRYYIWHLTREFALYADRYERAADQLDAAGHPDKAKKAREKASELREKVSRLEGKFGRPP